MRQTLLAAILIFCSAAVALNAPAPSALSGHSAHARSADSLTAKEREAAVRHLEETRDHFLRSINGLSEAQWNYKPAPDRWSVAEVAEHIALSESLILQLVTERVLKTPATKQPAGSPTDETVIKTITDRSGKAQAPEVLKPAGKWATREALTRDFTDARARTIAYVRETQENLRAHAAPHPVLKAIDAYQWLLLLSAHSARHTAQIEEVKADPGFPRQ
jgi:uncharacterized damage-inducible protein DinB